jgi:hypothetical protein
VKVSDVIVIDDNDNEENEKTVHPSNNTNKENNIIGDEVKSLNPLQNAKNPQFPSQLKRTPTTHSFCGFIVWMFHITHAHTHTQARTKHTEFDNRSSTSLLVGNVFGGTDGIPSVQREYKSLSLITKLFFASLVADYNTCQSNNFTFFSLRLYSFFHFFHSYFFHFHFFGSL